MIRGTAADTRGNISFCEEIAYMDALAQAQAAKNSGGMVIVQVKQLVDEGAIPVHDIRLPGFLVDFVVVAPEGKHPQTYGTYWNPSYTSHQVTLPQPAGAMSPANSISPAEQIICYRAALELQKHPGATVNIGIGIPASIATHTHGWAECDYTVTVESGVIGGIPDAGLSFGASSNPQAIIKQSDLFDFYDGGGIDVAFLGFAEVDAQGNVNASKFGGRFPGCGGFINISQSAKKIVFCGR